MHSSGSSQITQISWHLDQSLPDALQQQSLDPMIHCISVSYASAWNFGIAASSYRSFSETYWHAVDLAKPCLYCNAMLCGSDFGVPFSWWWKHLKTSPLLEFYIRVWLTLLKCFDVISQHDISAIKALEISLKLKRYLFRKHDYAAYMTNINGALPVVISLACLTCIALSYHVVAFKLIGAYTTQIVCCVMQLEYLVNHHFSNILDLIFPFIFGYIDMPCIISSDHWSNQMSKPTSTTYKIVGGGISKVFTLEELYSFIDHGITAEKFKFLSYLSQASAAELQDTNDFLVPCTIPLSNLVPKLTVSDLKVIAKCHDITIHFKMKSQEIQTAITSHICTSCQEHVSIFQIIDEPHQSQKLKTANLKATKKYQAKHPKKYEASHLEAVKKSQASNSDYKASHLNECCQAKLRVLMFT
jgi:hypothetical protein